jgi:hypothetical protein
MNANNKKPKSLRILALACGAVLISSSFAQGAISFGINQSYNGTAPHSSTTPWINTVFQDIGPNTVRLTITAPNLTSGHLANPEFLKSLYLNFNDAKDVTALDFTPVYGLWHGLSPVYSLDLGQTNFQASAGGNYSILLGFQTKGGVANQFTRETRWSLISRPRSLIRL